MGNAQYWFVEAELPMALDRFTAFREAAQDTEKGT